VSIIEKDAPPLMVKQAAEEAHARDEQEQINTLRAG